MTRPRTGRPPASRNAWRNRIIVFALAASASLGLVWFKAARPCNVLLITLDTTRADRIGCYGYTSAETPTLDSLAGRAALFERAYVPAPMTAPSHASMLTGLFPPEHGIWTNGGVALEADVPVLAEFMRRQGFATAAFVSSVVLQAKYGLNRGFDLYDDHLSSGEVADDEHGRSRDGKHVIDAVLNWLTERPARPAPFFCWVHLFDPHDPYLPHRDEFGDQFEDRPYDAEIAYVDRQLGRLFAALANQGILDQTVIVVAGDHGESLGEHGEQQHGYMLHESTLRVPLMIADPRGKFPGRRVSTPVSLVDLFPTLLTLGGVTPPTPFADRNLMPALQGKPLSPRSCYSQSLEGYQEAGWSPLQGLTTERWRYVRTSRPELYDLSADPAELQNVAGEQPDLVREMDRELASFVQGLKHRSGSQRTVSARERRSLESLGYAGASSVEPGQVEFDQQRPDIKDMIVPLNALFDARKLVEDREYSRAAELLQPIAEAVPNFLRARFTLGICLFQQGQLEDAAKWFDAALEIDPKNERAHDMLGLAYLKLRKLDLAEKQFMQVLELNPESESAHLFLGEIAQRQEQFPLAMRYYSETLRINPRNRQAREVLNALYEAGFSP